MVPQLKLPRTQDKCTEGPFWTQLEYAEEAILDKARMQRGAILAVQGSLSRGAILGLDNIGWSDVM